MALFLFLREELGTHNQNTHPPAFHLCFVRALSEQKGVSGAAGKGDLAVSDLFLSQGMSLKYPGTAISECPHVFPFPARNKKESYRVFLVADLPPVSSSFSVCLN